MISVVMGFFCIIGCDLWRLADSITYLPSIDERIGEPFQDLLEELKETTQDTN